MKTIFLIEKLNKHSNLHNPLRFYYGLDTYKKLPPDTTNAALAATAGGGNWNESAAHTDMKFLGPDVPCAMQIRRWTSKVESIETKLKGDNDE